MIDFNGVPNNSFLISRALEQKQSENLGLDLRNIDKLSKDEKIKQISIQFEQMFIKTLLKDAFKDDNKESGFFMGSGTINDLRHSLFSQHITENGGLGYQKIIERQIREKYFNNDDDEKQSKTGSNDSNSIDINFIRTFHGTKNSIFGDNAIKYNSLNNLLSSLKKEFSVNADKKTRPVDGIISSDFGWREDPFDKKIRFHAGIDIAVPVNTPVKSFMDGEVVFAGWKKGYGNFIEIQHPNGLISKYGHNSKLLVKKGDRINSGTVICMSGSTGRSTGPHLHFEINKNNKAIDPKKMLP
jgi:murein DD-endopeptidase MepM/ murein hydrolase activator NlpD